MASTLPAAILRSTRRTTPADGLLVDATKADLAGISRDHFPDRHLAMTSAVFALIEQGIDSEDTSHFAEVWHKILWSAHVCRVRPVAGGHTFKVGLHNGRRLLEFKVLFRGNDCGERCVTVMLACED